MDCDLDCKKKFNIINIIFFVLFLCITFTGNTFNVYNNIRNTITNSKYEINKDIFYISKNILSLPIIIIIYFFLNNTELNFDFTNKDLKFINFLKKYTDLLKNKEIPFLYLFNISHLILFCPVIMILTLMPFYMLKYLKIKGFNNNYFYVLFGLFICYLLLEILLYFDFTNKNNLYSNIIKFLYFFIIVLLLINIPIYIYKTNNKIFYK